MLSVVERIRVVLLVYLWEAAAILEEEKVKKETGYQSVSDNAFCEVLLFHFWHFGSYIRPKPGSLIEVHKASPSMWQ